jgi:hypothetical protein
MSNYGLCDYSYNPAYFLGFKGHTELRIQNILQNLQSFKNSRGLNFKGVKCIYNFLGGGTLEHISQLPLGLAVL